MKFIPVAHQAMRVVVEDDQIAFPSSAHDAVSDGCHFLGRGCRIQGAVKNEQGQANAPGLFQRRPLKPGLGLLDRVTEPCAM